MKESLNFVLDGISSRDMKCMQVSMDAGLYEEIFLPQKSIREVKVRGNNTPYHYGVDYEPLNMPMVIKLNDNLSDNEVRAFCRWIDQPYYKEFYFENRPDRRFYVMYEGDSRRLHNGVVSGIVSINFRCNSPYSYSPVFVSDTYDLSDNPLEGSEIVFVNSGDLPCKPILEFEKVGNGDMKIVNLSNAGQEFELKALLNGEKIRVDNHHKEIDTDIVGTYRYDNHNDVFLEMLRGNNYLKVYGNVKDMKFIYQFETKG